MKCYRMSCDLSRFCQDRLPENSRHHLKKLSDAIHRCRCYCMDTIFPKLPLSIEVWCIDPFFPKLPASQLMGSLRPGRLKRQKNRSCIWWARSIILHWVSWTPISQNSRNMVFTCIVLWQVVNEDLTTFLVPKSCLQNFTLLCPHVLQSHPEKSESG